MPVAFVDGFDHYPSDMAADGYGITSVWSMVRWETGHTGTATGQSFVTGLNIAGVGYALMFSVPTGNSGFFPPDARRGIPATQQVSFAFGLMLDRMPINSTHAFLRFRDGSATDQFTFRVNLAGHLELRDSTNTIIWTHDESFLIGVRYFIAVSADQVTGNISVAINGSVEATLEGQSLGASDIQEVFWAGPTHGTGGQHQMEFAIDDSVCYYDEAVVIPEGEVSTLQAGADTTDKDWTPSTGVVNFEMIDDERVNGDEDYNYSDVVGAKDLFEFADLPFIPENVHCVSIVNCGRKESGATRTIKGAVLLDGTYYYGSDYNLSTSWTYDFAHFRTSPDTGVEWTPEEINAIKAGYELVV